MIAEALIQLRDENNIGSQVGAIAFGGMLGLVSARRRGFFRKLTHFFFGVGGIVIDQPVMIL